MAGVDDVDNEVEETEQPEAEAVPAKVGLAKTDQPTTAAGKADGSADEDEDDETRPARSAESDALWAEVRIDPVELALPKSCGYTLRAYRMSDEVTFSDVNREEDDFTVLQRPTPVTDLDLADEEFEDLDDVEDTDDDDTADSADDSGSESEKSDEESDEESDDDEDDDEEDSDGAEAEEIPVFLGHGGRLYLFETAQALVDFVKSDAEHELSQVDGWARLRERITAEDVVPNDDDRYELDLVVDNLRGGQDVWDADLLIRAGEVARDLGYALRIDPLLTALAPGSPLDDLDEALRSANAGGVGGFFARRRLKKIGAQQAALGWRTIIGKISAAVDWRE